MKTKTGLSIRALMAAIVACVALLWGVGTAVALPPGGAGDSTEGTQSSVTPTVQAGGTIGFALTGFPPGEVVYIKIDDGALAGGDASVQGQGVVHSQVIGPDGSVSGSFVLPSYVPAGQHWLRFLASQPRQGHGGGVIGFTNRSPEFTVVVSSGGVGSSGGAGGAGGSGGSAGGGTQLNGDGGAGQVSGGGAGDGANTTGDGLQNNVGSFAAPGASPAASEQAPQSAQASPGATTAPGSASATQTGEATAQSVTRSAHAEDGTATPAAAARAQQGGFPLVGAIVLGITVVTVGAGLAVLLVRKRATGVGSTKP